MDLLCGTGWAHRQALILAAAADWRATRSASASGSWEASETNLARLSMEVSGSV
jgi:hypothetical protein